MSYIGRQLNNLSDRVKLDSITTSATATYNLLLNGVAYVPSSAESLTVSLNGVIQSPIDSYTCSSSQITFASTLSASDSIDFILAERSITLQTPSSGSVNTEQLASGSVTAPKLSSTAVDNTNTNSTLITAQTEKSSLADADKFLISDSAASGALKYVQKSNLPSGGLVYLGGQSTHTNAGGYYIDNVMSDTYTNYKIVGVMMQDNTSSSIFSKLRSWDGSSGGNLSSSYNIQATTSSANNASGGTSPVGSGAAAVHWNDTKFTVAKDPYNDRNTNQYGVIVDYTLYRPASSNAYLAAPYLVGQVGFYEYNGGTPRFRVYSTTITYNQTVTNLGGISFFADSGNMSMIDISVYGMVGS